MTGCANSQTLPRRVLVRIAGRRPAQWVSAAMIWRLYGFLEWASLRAQDLAMALEDDNDRSG